MSCYNRICPVFVATLYGPDGEEVSLSQAWGLLQCPTYQMVIKNVVCRHRDPRTGCNLLRCPRKSLKQDQDLALQVRA